MDMRKVFGKMSFVSDSNVKKNANVAHVKPYMISKE